MANWSLPTVSSDYVDVLDELSGRLDDAYSLAESPSNQPTGAIRYNRSLNKFQEWDGAAWQDKVLAVAGGGTGGATASAARTALGLGTMATQDNNAVNITGGTITGVNLSASAITSGVLALARGGTGKSLSLGAVGTVFISDGVDVDFRSGANIANLSASNLTSGSVPVARLASLFANANVWTAANSFSGGDVTVNSPLSANITLIQLADGLVNIGGGAGILGDGSFIYNDSVGSQQTLRLGITRSATSRYLSITDTSGYGELFSTNLDIFRHTGGLVFTNEIGFAIAAGPNELVITRATWAILCTNLTAASQDIHSMTDTTPEGQFVFIFNEGTDNIVIKHNQSPGVGFRKFFTPAGLDYTLTALTGVLAYNSPLNNAWILMSR